MSSTQLLDYSNDGRFKRGLILFLLFLFPQGEPGAVGPPGLYGQDGREVDNPLSSPTRVFTPRGIHGEVTGVRQTPLSLHRVCCSPVPSQNSFRFPCDLEFVFAEDP